MIILFLMTGQNDSIAVGIPGSHGGGHIFFDGDFDFEGQVKAEVGNAEAADAEDFADQVAAVYNCAQGKGEIGLLLCFIEPLVCCGDFYIEPLEIQIEFSKANNATDWLVGLLFRHTERIRSIDGTLFVLTCISRPDAISPAFS